MKIVPRNINAPYPPSSARGGYTGQAPTNCFSGYLDCADGEPTSAIQACASGTQFDVKSGTCTWRGNVVCKTGNNILSQVGSNGNSGNGGNGGDDGESPGFCPEQYTGRAPSTNCEGYAECSNGKGGLSSRCPPDMRFNHATQQCQYDLEGCEMLNGDEVTEDNVPEHVNQLDAYCPTYFTGWASTRDCEGYVDCKNGQAKCSKSCPGTTKFDVMIMACIIKIKLQLHIKPC
jgi:hypothetical protein